MRASADGRPISAESNPHCAVAQPKSSRLGARPNAETEAASHWLNGRSPVGPFEKGGRQQGSSVSPGCSHVGRLCMHYYYCMAALRRLAADGPEAGRDTAFCLCFCFSLYMMCLSNEIIDSLLLLAVIQLGKGIVVE